MKCENCPACQRTYDCEFECVLYPESDCVELTDGSIGCKHPYNAIKKRLDQHSYSFYDGLYDYADWKDGDESCGNP